jgi:phosphatidylglycerophosphate synthase
MIRLIAQLRQQYLLSEQHRAERNYYSSRFIYRPLGILIAAASIRLGFSANALSIASLLVFSAAMLQLAHSGGVVIAAIGLNVCWILDHADGLVARWHGRSSTFGSFLDGLIDASFSAQYLALGYHINVGHSDTHWPLALGGSLTFFVLFGHYFRVRLASMNSGGKTAPARPSHQAGNTRRHLAKFFQLSYRNWLYGEPLLFLVLAIMGNELVFLIAAAFIHFAFVAIEIMARLRTLYRNS